MLTALVSTKEAETPPDAASLLLQDIQTKLSALELTDKPKGVLLLLSSYDHNKHDHYPVLTQIRAIFPDMPLVGCSSIAEISSDHRQLTEDALTLIMLIHDQAVRMVAGVVKEILPERKGAILDAFNRSCSELEGQEKLCLMFPPLFEGQCVTSILEIIRESNLNSRCKIFGGMSTAAWTTQLPEKNKITTIDKSFQYYNDEICKNSMPYILIAGRNLKCSHGYGDGVLPFTQAVPIGFNGNQITHINYDMPEKFLSLHNHPLASGNENDFWIYPSLHLQCNRRKDIRDIILKKQGQFEILGDKTFSAKSTKVRLTRCTPESVRNSSEIAISQAIEKAHFKPALMLVFSSVTRLYVLRKAGEDLEQEYYRLSLGRFPAGLPFLIFYCFGEIGPRKLHGPSIFNSTSMVTLLIGESKSLPQPDRNKPRNVENFASLSWNVLYQMLSKKGLKKHDVIDCIKKDFENKLKISPPSEETIDKYINELREIRLDREFIKRYEKNLKRNRRKKNKT